MSISLPLEATNSRFVFELTEELSEETDREPRFEKMSDGMSVYLINGFVWLDLIKRGPEAS